MTIQLNHTGVTTRKIQKLLIRAFLICGLLSSGAVFSADDPSIKGSLRSQIQASMSDFIDTQTIDGNLFLYDAPAGNLLELELDELHSGIVKKGDFYVSCADFVDQQGRKIDVDFMVRDTGSTLLTTQAIVHSIDGDKRPYHLENH